VNQLSQQHAPSGQSLSGALWNQHAGMGEQDAGMVTCAYCHQELTLTHAEDGTHYLIQQSLRQENQLVLPGFSPEAGLPFSQPQATPNR
jgi:hypothetical protein